jgi:hypothetical protein
MLTEHFVTYEELNDVICRSVIYYLLIDKQSIKVITKLPNSEQSYKGKVQTHNYINT